MLRGLSQVYEEVQLSPQIYLHILGLLYGSNYDP